MEALPWAFDGLVRLQQAPREVAVQGRPTWQVELPRFGGPRASDLRFAIPEIFVAGVLEVFQGWCKDHPAFARPCPLP